MKKEEPKEEPKKEEKPEPVKEEPKKEPEEEPLEKVKRQLKEGGNKVSLDLLDLYKLLPTCQTKPDFVDTKYYETRKKETKVTLMKDDFKRGSKRNQHHHDRHHRDYNDFERGTQKQQVQQRDGEWRQ